MKEETKGFFTKHTIAELVAIAKVESDRVSKLTPTQVWRGIIENTHLYRSVTEVNKEQSKALYEIEEIAVNQLDNIRFPKKK